MRRWVEIALAFRRASVLAEKINSDSSLQAILSSKSPSDLAVQWRRLESVRRRAYDSRFNALNAKQKIHAHSVWASRF